MAWILQKQQQIQSFPSNSGSIWLTIVAGFVLLALSVAKSVVQCSHGALACECWAHSRCTGMTWLQP